MVVSTFGSGIKSQFYSQRLTSRLGYVPYRNLTMQQKAYARVLSEVASYGMAQLWPDTLAPATPSDPILAFHHSSLHMAFLYVDLCNTIRMETGPHIITHWKLWLLRFIATGCKNYATPTHEHIC